MKRVVVGLGHLDRGDDAVGLAVVQALTGAPPAGVQLVGGVGDPAALLTHWAGADFAAVVDAAAGDDAPGTIHRLEGRSLIRRQPSQPSTHGQLLAPAIGLAQALDLLPKTLVVYAVVGSDFRLGVPMTPAVAAAVPVVTRRIQADLKR